MQSIRGQVSWGRWRWNPIILMWVKKYFIGNVMKIFFENPRCLKAFVKRNEGGQNSHKQEVHVKQRDGKRFEYMKSARQKVTRLAEKWPGYKK